MLKNKKGLVFGVANNHSIAWGIAKQLAENGAEIAIGYQNEILLKRVKPLSEEINSKILLLKMELICYQLMIFIQERYLIKKKLKIKLVFL